MGSPGPGPALRGARRGGNRNGWRRGGNSASALAAWPSRERRPPSQAAMRSPCVCGMRAADADAADADAAARAAAASTRAMRPLAIGARSRARTSFTTRRWAPRPGPSAARRFGAIHSRHPFGRSPPLGRVRGGKSGEPAAHASAATRAAGGSAASHGDGGRAAAPHRRGRVARYPAAPRRSGRGCGPTGGRPGGAHDPGRGDGEGSRGGATPAAATTAAPVAAETGRHTHPTSTSRRRVDLGRQGPLQARDGPDRRARPRDRTASGRARRREAWGKGRRARIAATRPRLRRPRSGPVGEATWRKDAAPTSRSVDPAARSFLRGRLRSMGGNEPDRRGRSRPGCSGGPEKSSLPSGRSRENRSAG